MSRELMRQPIVLNAALLLAAVALSPVVAGDGVETREEIEIRVLGDGGEVESIELVDLDEGETRQYSTDSGKEVVVSRGDEGLRIELDGKTIEVMLCDEVLDVESEEAGCCAQGRYRYSFHTSKEAAEGYEEVVIRTMDVEDAVKTCAEGERAPTQVMVFVDKSGEVEGESGMVHRNILVKCSREESAEGEGGHAVVVRSIRRHEPPAEESADGGDQ